MVAWTDWAAFGLIALGMALTPGPNMIYLISRSISPGKRAGLVSLAGVALGFIFYMLSAVVGLTALVMAIPLAYDALRIGGAMYLAWLAWKALKPGAGSPFEVRALEPQNLDLERFVEGWYDADTQAGLRALLARLGK